MKFMCTHTVGKNQVTPEQLRQIAQAAQNDPQVKPYRSFCNLTEGKILCVMEAPDRAALASWFQRMNMPVDTIVTLEYEGERGNVREEHAVAAAL